MPANEAAILNNFISNPQNTHRAVIANSVGMAILVLKSNYFEGTDSEVDINKKYERCIEEIKLAAKNIINRQQAANFLILSAKEVLNKYDEVHLYIPAGNKYLKTTYTFPLTQVITLVWLALKDHEKFAHELNYQGTKEQQFARARGEYNLRLNNFFNLIFLLGSEGSCHQGIRNELVFLLNKIYFGIEVIEDDLSTISATLKDHINILFWEQYQKAKTLELKKLLTTALFAWMSDQNSEPLLTLVDPENKAKKILTELFLRHGSNPVEIGLDQLIKDCLPTLSFNYDPKQYPVIKVIENIFNSVYDNNNETTTRALTNVIAWIKAQVELENQQTTANLIAYFTLYQAYRSLDQRMQSLLKATGNMKDSYSELLTHCETYFNAITGANLENEFPITNTAMLKTTEQLKSSIVDCKSNKMVDFIESFFNKWNLAYESDNISRYATLRHLYRILIDVEFHEKVFMSDEEIDFFWNHADTSKPFREMTAYQINRIFLHGIIKEHTDWTDNFSNLYRKALNFIENDYYSYGSTHLNRNLIEYSYTDELTRLLKYRLYSSSSVSYIFLPREVDDISDWEVLADLVSEDKLFEIYQTRPVKIKQILYNSLIGKSRYANNRPIHRPIYRILSTIPPQYRAAFLLEDRVYNLCREGNGNFISEYITAVNTSVPEDERINVWKSLLKKSFKYLTVNNVYQCIESLPESHRLTFFILFSKCKSGFYHSIEKFHAYDDMWLLLSSTDLLTYLKRFTPEKMVEIVISHAKKFINKFDLAQIADLAESVKPSLNEDIINTFKYLELDELKMLQQQSILDSSVDFTELYIDKEYWEVIFKKIPEKKRLIFLTAFRFEAYEKLFQKLPITHLHLIHHVDRMEFLNKLGNDYIIHQIVNENFNCDDLIEIMQLRIDHSFKKDLHAHFIKTFSNIYRALREGQTSFFKSNILANLTIVEKIIEYATANPNSRTAKAVSLMKKFSNYKTSNHDLLKEIYLHSFSKSGLFKRAKHQSTYYYNTQSLEKSMTFYNDSTFWKDNHSASKRRAMILNCLEKPDPYEERPRLAFSR
jgi:hypothetical protein